MTATVMTVYGTRPEAIKIAPVIRALRASGDVTPITVVTGQHREMLDQVNQIFGILPDHDLDVFSPGQALNALMARIFDRLDPILATMQPDALLVQGDTSTVAAASMAGFYRRIPIVHLEAGLRSGDLWSPFPEEANRRITTQVTTLHLAPTARARDSLLAEGVAPASITVTGNTVIDALHMALYERIEFTDPRLVRLEEGARPILLVTTHRRENWGGAMDRMGRALRRLALRYPSMTIVLPAHRNPVVRAAVLPHLEELHNVITTEPLHYGEFAHLMALAHLVLTDSGGVQEEAPALGKPVLVMRDNTERPEAIIAGTVRLIGTEEDRIVSEVAKLMDDPQAYARMANAVNPYGDGRAAPRCVAAIRAMLGRGARLSEFRPENQEIGSRLT